MQLRVEQVEEVTGLAAGAGRKFFVRLPPDIPPGVVYLELQHGPFVGGACPALVMPPERAAAAVELLQALRARDALLKGGWLPAGSNVHRPTAVLRSQCESLTGRSLCGVRLGRIMSIFWGETTAGNLLSFKMWHANLARHMCPTRMPSVT